MQAARICPPLGGIRAAAGSSQPSAGSCPLPGSLWGRWVWGRGKLRLLVPELPPALRLEAPTGAGPISPGFRRLIPAPALPAALPNAAQR